MTSQEALKNLDKPKGRWGTILATTPIIMTVLATVFAGLSSSEMTQAMFHRSLASQQQSKAGDQWAYFQAKRIRGTGYENSMDLLQSVGHAIPTDRNEWMGLHAKLAAAIATSSLSPTEKEAAGKQLKIAEEQLKAWLVPEKEAGWAMLNGGLLPVVEVPRLENSESQQQLDALLAGLAQRQPDEELYRLVKPLTAATLELAIRQAHQASDQFEKQCEPANEVVKRVRSWLRKLESVANRLTNQDLLQRTLAGCQWIADEYDARRLRSEANYNRRIAEHYEARVWRSGMESDRHRNRSQLFFYSMLIAQIGVTISSLALAQARRNSLWFVAAITGILALSFSAWVYLSW